jgi:hypothetical protein
MRGHHRAWAQTGPVALSRPCCHQPLRRGHFFLLGTGEEAIPGLACVSAGRILNGNGKYCCTLLAALRHAVQGNWPRGWHAWGEASMRRRDLLKTAAAATLSAGVAPRLGRGADRAKTLVFVPTSDLTILDPVVTGHGRRETPPISYSIRFTVSIPSGRHSHR